MSVSEHDRWVERVDAQREAAYRAHYDINDPDYPGWNESEEEMTPIDKDETNEEFIVRVMNFGSPTGALIQPFIIEALSKYCNMVEHTPANVFDSPMLNGEAWKRTGAWLKSELEKRYGKAR